MVRLGAKRTVTGYLSEVTRKALLWELDDSPLPDQIRHNWDALLADLHGKWRPQSFTNSLIDFHAGHSWGFAQGNFAGPLGREDHLRFCCPSVIDLVHSNLEKPDAPCWSERGLTVQGWKVRSRAGSAKIEVIPSPLAFSPHALERLYERIGGIDYAAFPALVGRVTDTILHKIDPVVAAGVFFRDNKHSGVTAIPVEGGLAIVEANEVYLGKHLPHLGAEVRVKRGNATQRAGTIRLQDYLTGEREDPILALTMMYVVRTFYGQEELNARRDHSVRLLEMVLERLSPSPLSLYSQMGVESPAYLASAVQRDADHNLAAFKTLVADTVDSMDWLQLHRDDQLFIFSESKGLKAADAITSFRKI